MEQDGWDIRREGRSWTASEFRGRADLLPEKLEIYEGQLLFERKERLELLGLLLENVGADQVVRMGRPDVWVEAVREAHPLRARNRFLSNPYDRWLLAMWIMTVIVVWTVAIVPKDLPPPSPNAVWLLVTAGTSAFVSFVVSGFLTLTHEGR